MSKSHAPTLGANIPLDVDKLVKSRLLVQANSGGGKSWALRRVSEQAYSLVPQIIIDVEGEFHTLREKYDFVLANQKGGDTLADLKTAPLLARRLLELNVSAIIDIYELGVNRVRFVKLFLDALVNAPRDLWHPLLVFVDEAHMFCPEKSPCESSSAVIDLMTRGRKRGFCGILATQRISKLSKDAAAECNNKLIGRSALDVDMKRASEECGFTSKDEMRSLRKLPPGTFYAFGPAISDEVKQIKIGSVETTHPEAGARALPPTPPRDRIKKVLAQLADLPQEAEEEAKTAGELRIKVKQLETELKKAKAATPTPKTETKIVEKPILKDAQVKRLETVIGQMFSLGEKLVSVAENAATDASNLRAAITSMALSANHVAKAMVKPAEAFWRSGSAEARDAKRATTPKIERAPRKAAVNGDPIKLPVGETAVLAAAIQFADSGLVKKRLSVLTGYKRSTRDAYIARLREKGLLEERGEQIFPTEEGIAALPNAEPLPTGYALREFWYRELPAGERQILEHLVEQHPDAVVKASLDEVTGFKRSTRDAYLARLGAKLLVEDVGRAEVKASDNLFD
jgi:hypothetical protein